jgi:hypothetical protein
MAETEVWRRLSLAGYNRLGSKRGTFVLERQALTCRKRFAGLEKS